MTAHQFLLPRQHLALSGILEWQIENFSKMSCQHSVNSFEMSLTLSRSPNSL